MSISYTPVETNFCRSLRFYNSSVSTTVYAGDLLCLDGSGLVAVVANNNQYRVLGVCKTASVAAGAYGEVWVEGVFQVNNVASPVDFAEGDPAYAASASTIDAGSPSDIAVGYIVWADPTSTATTLNVAIHTFIFDSKTHS